MDGTGERIPDDLKHLAYEILVRLNAGQHYDEDDIADVASYLLDVRMEERERCAKIAEAEGRNAPMSVIVPTVANIIAAAIRS